MREVRADDDAVRESSRTRDICGDNGLMILIFTYLVARQVVCPQWGLQRTGLERGWALSYHCSTILVSTVSTVTGGEILLYRPAIPTNDVSSIRSENYKSSIQCSTNLIKTQRIWPFLPITPPPVVIFLPTSIVLRTVQLVVIWVKYWRGPTWYSLLWSGLAGSDLSPLGTLTLLRENNSFMQISAIPSSPGRIVLTVVTRG